MGSKIATEAVYFLVLESILVTIACSILTIMSSSLAYGRNAHLKMDKSLKQDHLEENQEDFWNDNQNKEKRFDL